MRRVQIQIKTILCRTYMKLYFLLENRQSPARKWMSIFLHIFTGVSYHTKVCLSSSLNTTRIKKKIEFHTTNLINDLFKTKKKTALFQFWLDFVYTLMFYSLITVYSNCKNDGAVMLYFLSIFTYTTDRRMDRS